MKFVANLRAGGWGSMTGSVPAIVKRECRGEVELVNLTGATRRETRPINSVAPLTGKALEDARALAMVQLEKLDAFKLQSWDPIFSDREAIRAALQME